MERHWQAPGADDQSLLRALQDIDTVLQVAVAEDGSLALTAGSHYRYARAWPDAAEVARPEPLRSMPLAQLSGAAQQAGAGIQLEPGTALTPALVVRLARSRLVQHAQRSWLLEFCPVYSGRTLRDLLALRSERELPPLQVWRAICLDAPQQPPEHWLLGEAPLRDEQIERCRAGGYHYWLRAALNEAQPQLAGLAADLPLTRMGVTGAPSVPAWLPVLLLGVGLLLGGMLWTAYSDHQQRIQTQQANAGMALGRMFEGPARSYLDPLFEALVRLGVPASVGGQLIDLPSPEGLDADAQRVALQAVLGEELGARLQNFAALEAYMQEQAQRIGQRRMVLSGEYCRHGFGVVMPLLAKRDFVLTVEQPPGERLLRWSGVAHIDARELERCRALGTPRLN